MPNKHELSHFSLILEKRSSSLHSSPQVNCVSVFKIQGVPTSRLSRIGIPSRCPWVPCRLHSPHTTSDQVSGVGVSGTDVSLAHSWLQMCRHLREPAGRCHSGKHLIRRTPPTYSSCPGGLATPHCSTPHCDPQRSLEPGMDVLLSMQWCPQHPPTQ